MTDSTAKRGSGRALRLGLMSTATIHDRAVFSALLDVDGIEVRAVASRDGARAQAYAREHAIPMAYSGYRSLLDAPDVDAVYVTVPNALHLEWTRRALAAGKHVLCEKPFDADPRAAAELESEADRRGLVVREAFHYAFHPELVELVTAIHRGWLGEVRAVRAEFGYPLEPGDDVRWSPELHGGALMDVGSYCLHAAQWVLTGDRMRVVQAEVERGPTGVDVWAHLHLESASGVPVTIRCSLVRPQLRMRLEVEGQRESVEIDAPYYPAVRHLDGCERWFRWRRSGRGWRPRRPGPARLSYSHQMEAFRDTVAGRLARVPYGHPSLTSTAALLSEATKMVTEAR